MSDSTHAFLSAKKVCAACSWTLQDIAKARTVIAREVAREMRAVRPWLWFKPVSRIVATMPDYLVEIVNQHRMLEAQTVASIRDLAQAAAREDATFTIYVSASDFALIKDRYK